MQKGADKVSVDDPNGEAVVRSKTGPSTTALRFNLGIAGLAVGFGLLMLGLRLVFIAANRAVLDEEGWTCVLWAVGHGLRFDAATTALVLAPAVLLYHGAVLTRGRVLRRLLVAYLVVAVLGVSILWLADLQYFDETGKHFTYEPLVYLGAPAIPTFLGAFELYPWFSWISLLGAVAGAVAGWCLLRWWVGRSLGPRGTRRPRLLAWLPLWLAVGFVAARGSLGSYPLNIGDALISPSPVLNAVCLNPVYSVLRTAFRASERQYAFYDEAHNLRVVRRLLGLEGAEPEDPTYPLLRVSPGTPTGNRKNVVLFILESWSAKDVTCLGGRPGVTPVFDDLARDGRLFTNFHANGVRTAEGIFATTCSFPNQPVRRVLNRPVGWQTRWRSLGEVLDDAGYRTVFIHGRDLGFDEMESFLCGIGFREIIDRDDFPPSTSASNDAWPGYSDEAVVRRADEEFAAEAGRPFFGVIYTMNTHAPFPVPEGYPLLFDPGDPEGRFLNAMNYADYTLGVFFELARTRAYFKDTIFLFVADHARSGHLRQALGYTFADMHRVPFLVYGPGYVSAGRSEALGSQTDIMPTVLGLLGLRTRHASWGRDLLAPAQGKPLAVCISGDEVHWRTPRWLLVSTPGHGQPLLFDLQQDPQTQSNVWGASGITGEGVLGDLQAYLSLSQTLLYENRVFPQAAGAGPEAAPVSREKGSSG